MFIYFYSHKNSLIKAFFASICFTSLCMLCLCVCVFSIFVRKFLKVLCFSMPVVFACFFTSFVCESFCFFYAFAHRTFHLCLHFFFFIKVLCSNFFSHLCASCVCAHFFVNFVCGPFYNFCLHRSSTMRSSKSMFYSIHLIHVVLQMQNQLNP